MKIYIITLLLTVLPIETVVFNCHYAKPERVSDITIGDFWGLGNETDDNYIPKHPYGISCVLPLTEKR